MLDVFSMDWLFSLHRYVPFLILGWMLWLIGKEPKMESERGFKSKLHRPLWVISMICIVQITLGVIHIWFVIPSWTQVSHVVVGSGLISYIFAVYLSTTAVKATNP
jgi:heme A synthase